MKITYEMPLTDFKPWAGAKNVFYRLTWSEIILLENYLDGWEIDAVELNDTLWFETEKIFEWLDIDEEEFWKREMRGE